MRPVVPSHLYRILTLCVPALLALTPSLARAGNTDEVNAGTDVTLSGGAVVANVKTGASLWYNPAGVARMDKSSVEVTGITLRFSFINTPGLLTIDGDPPSLSEGKVLNIDQIPEAVTFTAVTNEKVKVGIGLFSSSIRRDLVQDTVSSAKDVTPAVKSTIGVSSRVDFLHISLGVGSRVREPDEGELLLGGAFDLVIATGRLDSTFLMAWDDGNEGLFSEGRVEVNSGFGFQLKGGAQWQPHRRVRLGLSLASPTFLFLAMHRAAFESSDSPPRQDSSERVSTDQGTVRVVEGGFWGIEPGTARLGAAYTADWGWLEADVVADLRLAEPTFFIDRKAVVNARVGSSFRMSKHARLGLGAFTDLSPIDKFVEVGVRRLDFYGAHLGLQYQSSEIAPPGAPAEAGKPAAGDAEEPASANLSVAVGLRYAYGQGQTRALGVPAEYQPGGPTQIQADTTAHELSINFGAKVLF